jgi:hypothetical protein
MIVPSPVERCSLMLRPRRTHEILGGRLRKGGCAHQLGWWLEVQALPRTRHKVPSGAQGDAQLVGHGLGRWLAENLGEHMDDGGEINVVIGTSPLSPGATWGDGKPERAAQAQLRHPVWWIQLNDAAFADAAAHDRLDGDRAKPYECDRLAIGALSDGKIGAHEPAPLERDRELGIERHTSLAGGGHMEAVEHGEAPARDPEDAVIHRPPTEEAAVRCDLQREDRDL